VVDLRDLAVFDAEADVAAFGLRPMHDADTDIVFAVDAHHPDLLIAHRRRRGLLHRCENLGVADVRLRSLAADAGPPVKSEAWTWPATANPRSNARTVFMVRSPWS